MLFGLALERGGQRRGVASTFFVYAELDLIPAPLFLATSVPPSIFQFLFSNPHAAAIALRYSFHNNRTGALNTTGQNVMVGPASNRNTIVSSTVSETFRKPATIAGCILVPIDADARMLRPGVLYGKGGLLRSNLANLLVFILRFILALVAPAFSRLFLKFLSSSPRSGTSRLPIFSSFDARREAPATGTHFPAYSDLRKSNIACLSAGPQ